MCPSCRQQIARPVVEHSPETADVGQFPVYATIDQRHNPVAEFRERMFANTPHVWITRAIVAVNVVIFIAMTFSCGELFMPGGDVLVEWGSNYGPLTLDGQQWRLITCMFIHIGVIHLAFNMWVLWDLGQLVERLVGNVGFVLLYFVSGVFGSLASVWWNPAVNSAGASGAVFGVFGALMGYIALRRDCVPKSIFSQLRNSGLMFLGINLVFGFSVKGIDMAAHIGGLAAGFLCGLAMSHALADVTRISRAIRNGAVAVVATVAISAAFVSLPAPPSNVGAELQAFSKVEGRVLETFSDAQQRAKSGETTAEEFADTLQSDIIQPWSDARAKFEKNVRSTEESQPLIDMLKRYMRLREEGWRSYLEGLRTDDPAMIEQYLEKQEAAAKLVDEIRQLQRNDPA